MRRILAVVAFVAVCLSATASDRKYIVNPRPGDTKALPFSDGVLAGNTLYIAGHIGLDPEDGTTARRSRTGSQACDGRHQDDGEKARG